MDLGYCCLHGVVSILRNLSYTKNDKENLYNLNFNFESLKIERSKLRVKKDEVSWMIRRGDGQGMKPSMAVTYWLERVELMELKLNEIIEPEKIPRKLPSECPLGCCYRDRGGGLELAKTIADALKQVVELRNDAKFNEDNMCIPSPVVEQLTDGEIIGMDDKFSELWSYLMDENIGVIKIYGMGGSGKTEMLKRVNNKFVTEDFDFNIVIWVDGSTGPRSIQLAIMKRLGLTELETRDLREGAQYINVYLQRRKFVLLLDDLQQNLSLAELGVPIPNLQNQCKVVFTTTNKAVHITAQKHKQFKMKLLSEEDSMTLLCKAAGHVSNLSPSVSHHAHKFLTYSEGLPLALIMIGSALVGMEEEYLWHHVFDRLMHYDSKVSSMEETYERLYLRYGLLQEPLKSFFLYCSLFPKHDPLREEELVYYWMGEHSENHIILDLDEVFREGFAYIKTLESACLLMKGDEQREIKMHDLIRGFARWISETKNSKHNYVRTKIILLKLPVNVNWAEIERVSLVDIEIQKLTKINCPSLLTLILRKCRVSEIGEDFFESMPSLRVLDMSSSICETMTKLPRSFTELENLRYLNLSWTSIVELPDELKKLKNLIYLDLSFTTKLLMISSGLIAELYKLQVFNMFHCGFSEKIKKDSILFGSGTALMEELKHLRHLQRLGITVKSDDALQILENSSKLGCTHSMLAGKSTSSEQVGLACVKRMEKLEVLHVRDCGWSGKDQVLSAFSSDSCFKKLCHVEFDNCSALKELTWLKYVHELQILKISHCEQLEEVVNDGNNSSDTAPTLFSKLKLLYVSYLPELKFICSHALDFPSLEEIVVTECRQLKKLPLHAHSASNLQSIKGLKEWWDTLQWGEEEKTQFSNYFRPSGI